MLLDKLLLCVIDIIVLLFILTKGYQSQMGLDLSCC